MDKTIIISVFAVPLSGNKGSASMFLGLRDAFKKKAIPANFNLFSYYFKKDSIVAEKYNNVNVYPGHPIDLLVKVIPAVLIGKFSPKILPAQYSAIYKAINETDVVVLVGGTTFTDSMVYKAPWNLIASLPGYILKKPTIFLSQTIGPFNKVFNRILAKWTLKRADVVHGRGLISTNNVLHLGIINCKYIPDLSFNMTVPDYKIISNENDVIKALATNMKNKPGAKFIGIAPNSIVYQKAKTIGIDYVDFLKEVIEVILQHDGVPIIIPHSYRDVVTYMHNNDRSLCSYLLDKINRKKEIIYLDADFSPGELRSIIGQLDLLISSRFHSMISALSMGVPPITYGWGHHKYLEVLKEFNVDELYRSYNDLSIDVFSKLYINTLERKKEISKKITDALPAVCERSLEVTDEIVNIALKE